MSGAASDQMKPRAGGKETSRFETSKTEDLDLDNMNPEQLQDLLDKVPELSQENKRKMTERFQQLLFVEEQFMNATKEERNTKNTKVGAGDFSFGAGDSG